MLYIATLPAKFPDVFTYNIRVYLKIRKRKRQLLAKRKHNKTPQVSNSGSVLNKSFKHHTFPICVGLRLGCDICREYTCKCEATVEPKELHPLSCLSSSGRYYRYSEVNNILKRALVTADIPCQLEPVGLDAE